ncbi:MAG: hypothetical protein BWY10_02531 [Chloroflexi bacterium ADurb.Bin180]|jgi:hypothetical protein|nr:hypothetical protein [Acidobacteriota bacterium]OQB25087.1 MAG: hypothetical protein BWY10_02531 [Chloroflexi bacterium ADurb.Bin180]
MIEQLPAIDEPEWLSHIDLDKFADAPLPLADILQDSLYYPASGYDADPVRYLAGNYVSFVYVDYGASEEELNEKLLDPEHGFAGYELIAQRSVKDRELDPYGWVQPPLLPEDHDPSWRPGWDEPPFCVRSILQQRVRSILQQRQDYPKNLGLQRFRLLSSRFRLGAWMKPPFCVWSILQRREDDPPPRHGPHRISLLYLCTDGAAAFHELYLRNGVTPGAVAIIQPGHAFGGNWTNFEDPRAILARWVLTNPAGKPKILLHGWADALYPPETPCWPGYEENVRFFAKTGGGRIGVWGLAQ